MYKGIYAAMLIGFSLVGSSSVSALAPTEVEKWQEDIEVYRQALEQRHINLYHTVDKQDFHEN